MAKTRDLFDMIDDGDEDGKNSGKNRSKKKKRDGVKTPRISKIASGEKNKAAAGAQNDGHDDEPAQSRRNQKPPNRVVSALLRLSQNTIDDFFSVAPSISSAQIARSRSSHLGYLEKTFLRVTSHIEDDIGEWIRKSERQNPDLIKTVTRLFADSKERYEFYLLRFLCSVHPSTKILELDDRSHPEEYLKCAPKNVVVVIAPDNQRKKPLTKKSSADATSKTSSSIERDFLNVRLTCLRQNHRAPYLIQNGKLHQSRYNANIGDKYAVYCLYALAKYIRNNNERDDRIIVVNCCVASIFKELMSDTYISECIRHKYRCIINNYC